MTSAQPAKTDPSGRAAHGKVRIPDRAELADALFDSALDAIIVADVDGRIVAFNPAAEQTFGWRSDEVIGRSISETIIPEQHRAAHHAGMARYLATGEARMVGKQTPTEVEAIRRDGSTIAIELTITEAQTPSSRYLIAHLRSLEAQIAAQRTVDQQKSLLSSFLDNAPFPMGVFMFEGEGTLNARWTLANKIAASYFNRTPQEMIGHWLDEFQHHWLEAEEKVIPAVAKVIETRQPVIIETLFDSGPVYGLVTFLVTFFPMIDEAGNLAGIANVSSDVTEQRKMEAELRKSQALFTEFIEYAPNPMTLLSPGKTMLLSNGATENYYGIKRDQIGPDAFQKHWPELESRIFPLFDDVLDSRKYGEVETPFIMPSGEIRTLRFTLFPIMGEDGKVSTVGNIVYDITDERRAQAELARSTESLHQSEKLAALGQLLAGVAHELNNPLAVVLGRAELLEEQLGGTPHAASLAKLTEAANRCARIVKAFLALARQTGPKRALADINEQAEIGIDLVAHGLRSAGITVACDFDPGLPLFEMDEDQIVQVLVNLLINAQHALEEGTQDPRLDVRTRFDREANVAVIEVADNGPGVPEEFKGRVFDPFFTTKDVGGGTGLGLSLCKSIVEGHNGQFTIMDTPGGGATFRVVLPVAGAAAVVEFQVPEPVTELSKGRVLIVDDEPEVAGLLADCLAPLGVECTIANSGAEALALLENGSFDVVFSDVRMPGMDGLTLFDRIAENHPSLAERFIFVSGDVLQRDFSAIAATHGRPVIEKPFNSKTVRDAARAALAAGEKS